MIFRNTTFFLLCFLLLSTAANAVPARPGVRRNLTLKDGSTVSALLVGDEHGHYWLGEDGKGYRSNYGVYEEIDLKSVQRSARRLNGAPTSPGVYIKSGRKIVL